MNLNEQQRQAAEFDGSHVLVLAGAGTGKTSTIAARAAHLLKTNVPAHRILLLTFTRRAAREMISHLETQVGAAAKNITAGTFHHFCLGAMRRAPKLFNFQRNTVIDRDDQVQLLKLTRAECVKKGEPFPKASQLLNNYSYARNTNQGFKKYLERYTEYDDETILKVLKIFKAYAARKEAKGYLDFDDILYRFASHVHGSDTCHRYATSLFEHILVDEMQDTNPLQWLILDGMRDPAKLFCVGDDAQSIYAFRGADFKNVHSFTERIPGSTVLKLEKNYRSTQEILDLSNWLLNASTLRYDKQLTADRGSGMKPKCLDFDSDYDEARWIAQDLVTRYGNGSPWNDHMVLFRTGYASRFVEAELISRDIPYIFIGGIGLFESAHVKDVLALIRASGEYRDELAWMRFLCLWQGIAERTAAKTINALSACTQNDQTLAVVQSTLAQKAAVLPPILSSLEGVQKVWPHPLKAVQQATEYLEPILKAKYDRWSIRKRDFKILEKLAAQHDSIPEFLENYALDPISQSEARRTIEEDKVTLITVHSAKGTEAPVCYIPKAEPGMYPHSRSLGDINDEEEERRILYVAMTRAKNELILTRSLRIYDYMVPFGGRNGEHSAEGQYYFLESFPEDLIDQEFEGEGLTGQPHRGVITPRYRWGSH